jgi:hypothetical protein
MPEPLADGPHIRRDFLPPADLLRVLAALDGLSASWTPSEALGLLGRRGTTQVRSADILVQSQLDEVRRILAPAALVWARACGFWFPTAPHLQLFPVRMVGDRQAPPYQDAHVDSTSGRSGAPLCTNVFYARTLAVEGGELALAGASDAAEPLVVAPTPNTIVTFRGDRAHWVRPLYAGERLSVVINFY